jgi:hypothetical protein
VDTPVICSFTPESITPESEEKDKRQWDAILDWARVAVEEEPTRL